MADLALFATGVLLGFLLKESMDRYRLRQRLKQIAPTLPPYTLAELRRTVPETIGVLVRVTDVQEKNGRPAIFMSTGKEQGNWTRVSHDLQAMDWQQKPPSPQ